MYPCVIGTGQLVIIVLVVLLLFGGKRIPELMRGMGRGVKEFKDAMNTDGKEQDKKTTKTQNDLRSSLCALPCCGRLRSAGGAMIAESILDF